MLTNVELNIKLYKFVSILSYTKSEQSTVLCQITLKNLFSLNRVR